MTTGFGSCANCGTPRLAPQQTACNVCGAQFPVAPAWSQQQPQGWQQPAQQQPPQGWQQQPQGWQQPAQQYGAPPAGYQVTGNPSSGQQPGFGQVYTPGYAPGFAPANKPPIALIAGIVGGIGALLVVILLAVVLLAGHGSSGGITISPSTLTCGQTVNFSETVKLPASIHAGDTVKVYGDGVFENSMTVDTSTWVKQNDGSWSMVYAIPMNISCTSSGSMSVGRHTLTIKDSEGKTLAEGSYTVNP